MLRLNPEILMRAYAAGIFPMAQSRDDPELFWIDPEWRGIIPLDKFHVPRRLKRTIRQERYEVTSNRAFAQVIDACAESGKGRPDSWINDEIANAYQELARLGHAYSIECWRNDKLAGGLYGVSLGGAFFGESMFTRQADASKVALVHLVARLRAGGYTLLDSQFTTQHLQQFGAVELTREAYKRLLADALEIGAHFPGTTSEEQLELVLNQRNPAIRPSED